MNTIINVRLLGFNGYRDHQNFKYILERRSDKVFRFQLSESDVHLTIVDPDSAEGSRFLISNKPGPSVYVATAKPPESGRYIISKPIKVDELYDVLDEFLILFNTHKSNISSKQALKNKNLSTGSSSNFYQPNNYLQGRILDSLSKVKSGDECIRLIMPFSQSEMLIIILTKDRKVFVSREVSELDKFYGFMFGETEVKIDYFKKSDPEIKDNLQGPSLSLEKLLWDASACASLGRLPCDTSETEQLRLKRWPNLTRKKFKPGFLQVAALWSQNSLSIEQMKQNLPKLEQQINAFYSAASSLDLFEEVHDFNDSGSRRTVDKGLFKKILSWVRS